MSDQPTTPPANRRKRLIATIILVLLAILFTFKGLAIISTNSDPLLGLTEEGKLRPCPPTPNAVCTEDPEASRRAPPLPVSTEQTDPLGQAITIAESMGATLTTRQDNYAHLSIKTSLLRFVDDLELRYDEDASCIHVRSASRVGHSDLGANLRRITRLHTLWSAAN